MKYNQKVITGSGTEVQIRNAEASDGAAVLENFNQTHAETDYLLSYPDENRFDAEQESRFLARKAESPQEIELLAVVNGRVVGTAGIDAVGTKYKVAHRAEFGISVDRAYWGLGVGRALMNAPAVVLADEPTGALDSKTGRLVMDLFHTLHREQGKTIVLITHDDEVARQASRIVRIKDGTLSEVDT